jgi:hypothetical protein
MKYRLALKTPPESEPITRDEAKLHFHETDSVQDDVVDGMIQAARVQAENFTSRGFLPQTFAMYMDGFPCNGSNGFREGLYSSEARLLVEILLSHSGEIIMPRAPLIQNDTLGIDFIKYIDTTGAQQTLDPALYQVDPQSDDDPVRIFPAYGKVWPATRPQPNAVTVQFQIGYADAAHVPAPIKLAIKQAVSSWYNNRDSVVVDARVAVQQLPEEAKDLLWDYRLF